MMILGYLLAGINHFRSPEPYYLLIPDYLPWKVLINIAAGVCEIVFAIGLLFSSTRKWAAICIIAMLVAFIPSHVWMIQKGGCFPKPGFCFPVWVMWVRLLLLQPLLIWWAWSVAKFSPKK